MTRRFPISLAFMLVLLLAPLMASAQDASASALSPAAAPTAWELSPYRLQLLTAVETGASLSERFDQDLPGDLAARVPGIVGGAWRLEASVAPVELRHRITHSLGDITADDLPAAVKGDKVILLGVAASDNGFQVQARELDLVTGLWNTVVTRKVRQASSVRQEALGCLVSAFAPQARIEKVENNLVTLSLRAAALARRDADTSLFMPGTVFRPALVKSDAKGILQPGQAEPIAWTFLTPTETKTAASPFTARIDTGLSGTPLPDYHPTRQRLALGVSPSQEPTRVNLLAEGTKAPLEGYEVAVQETDVAGKPGPIVSLGQSGPEGTVVIPPGVSTVRTLLVRHGEEVLARLPIVPGLMKEMTLSLPDDRPRLAIETSLVRIQDDLVDLLARREVLASRAKAATAAGDSAAAGNLKDQVRKLPGIDPLLAELGKQQQSIDALEGSSKQRMQQKLAEIRKLAEKLKSENPASKL